MCSPLPSGTTNGDRAPSFTLRLRGARFSLRCYWLSSGLPFILRVGRVVNFVQPLGARRVPHCFDPPEQAFPNWFDPGKRED